MAWILAGGGLTYLSVIVGEQTDTAVPMLYILY